MAALKACLIALCLLLQMQSVHAAPCDGPVKVRISSDYMPFSYKDQSGQITGLDVELLREIFAAIGCDYELIDLPFKRALKEVAKGSIDMMPFMSITPERQTFARFSVPYRSETAGFIMRKEDVSAASIQSLADILRHRLVLGHELGTYRGEEFEEFLTSKQSKNAVFQVASTSEGLRMLIAGRIDALVVSNPSVRVAAKADWNGKIAPHPFILSSKPVHFMFSRKTASDDFVDAINDAIENIIVTDHYSQSFGAMALSPKTRPTTQAAIK